MNRSEPSSAFGRIQRPREEQAQIGCSFRDTFNGGAKNRHEVFSAKFREAALRWRESLARDVGHFYQLLPHEASGLILTAFTNDAIALINHVENLDGRSASHSARALFEHLVNFLDVLSDTSGIAAQRYESHRTVTESQIAVNRWYLPYLELRQRKRETARLDRLRRRAAKKLPSLECWFGKKYNRSWAAATLHDRASAHDLQNHYTGYRILSSVVHGSSGSLAGITKTIGGQSIHRIGADLDLTALSYAEGLRSADIFLARVASATAHPKAAELVKLTSVLLNYFEDLRESLKSFDRRVWPENPPSAKVMWAAVYSQTKVRWVIYDPDEGSIVHANLLDTDYDLTDILAVYPKHHSEDFGGRPMTVEIPGLRLVPKLGAKPFPAASLGVAQDHPKRDLRSEGR